MGFALRAWRTVVLDDPDNNKGRVVMKPLESITVLEFLTMITASLASMMMAEQGRVLRSAL